MNKSRAAAKMDKLILKISKLISSNNLSGGIQIFKRLKALNLPSIDISIVSRNDTLLKRSVVTHETLIGIHIKVLNVGTRGTNYFTGNTPFG